jgi:hypothetical protein
MNHGESDIWVIKIDNNGNLIWEKTYGGLRFDAAEGVRPASDGGFILSGNSKSEDQDLTMNAGENDIWLLKIDSRGNLVWQQTFGGSDLDYGFDALESSDGSLLLVGESISTDFNTLENKGLTDLVFLKIE